MIARAILAKFVAKDTTPFYMFIITKTLKYKLFNLATMTSLSITANEGITNETKPKNTVQSYFFCNRQSKQ